jgi:hypothetical protein
MKRGWRATFCSLVLSAPGLPLSAEHPDIRARLQVYARVSPATLQEAKEVASFIFEKAGVRLSWAECPTREGEPAADQVCGLPTTLMDLQLRIIDKQMAKRAKKRAACLGYAVASGGEGSIASAYHHKAEELTASNMATQGAILGGILAHEIGHLLGIRQHSRQGVMRPEWDDHDLRALAKGMHVFTKEQASRVARSASSRTSR